MLIQFKNNAKGTLSAGITSGATSISLTAGNGANFPALTGSQYFYATLKDASQNLEIIKVTARATDTLTVVRAQEGTTARAYSASDVIELRPTAAGLTAIHDEAMADLLATANSFSAKQTFANTMKVQQALEKITITAAAPSATQTFDVLTQAVQYFTTNATANWTLNIRGDASNSLDSIMAVGESLTVTMISAQGASAYYASAHQIDGSAVTPKWIGGTAPSSGDASCLNIYTYTIIKTAAATFTVIASKAKTS